VEIISDWDHRADIDNIGMTLFFAWWEFIRNMPDRTPIDLIRQGKPLPADAQQAILTTLKEAASYMRKNYGSIRVPWGSVHRMKRGDRTWPVAGIAKHGLVTLRAVDGGDPGEDGVIYMDHGQFCTTVVLLKHPVRSYSAVPYGQSEYPESRHYADQAEKLFSKALLRSTWYQKEELMDHVESEKTLTVP
jgi:acyl-homoserine lactone acylase PvdQ